jgi:hypothetical protein
MKAGRRPDLNTSRVPFARTSHYRDRCQSQAAAFFVPLGDSMMFKQLFAYPRAIARQSDGSLLEERLRYPAAESSASGVYQPPAPAEDPGE